MFALKGREKGFMENASKALIIAGAILVAILLISIAIILINSGRDVVDTGTAGMNSQKIQAFNAQFTPYEGTKKGSELLGLKGLVEASKASYPDHKIEIIFTKGNFTWSDLQSSDTYNVKFVYATSGYITLITIT